MTKEKLLEEISDAKIIYVIQNQRTPHYISINSDTKERLGCPNEVSNMEVLIDNKLKDDEFRLLRK